MTSFFIPYRGPFVYNQNLTFYRLHNNRTLTLTFIMTLCRRWMYYCL